MKTYNSYEAAKIANTESDIYKLIGMDGFVFGNGLGDLIRITSLQTDAEKCKPADHCVTVEKFLADGYKFVEGDLILSLGGYLTKVEAGDHLNGCNESDREDSKRYILRAAALEEKPSEKAEWVNGDGVDWLTPDNKWCTSEHLFVGEHSNGSPVIERKTTGNIFETYWAVIRKPETKQQREDRERLAAAYDLYCYVSEKSGRAPFSIEYFTKSNEHCYKDDYLAIVDKTNYRKESK